MLTNKKTDENNSPSGASKNIMHLWLAKTGTPTKKPDEKTTTAAAAAAKSAANTMKSQDTNSQKPAAAAVHEKFSKKKSDELKVASSKTTAETKKQSHQQPASQKATHINKSKKKDDDDDDYEDFIMDDDDDEDDFKMSKKLSKVNKASAKASKSSAISKLEFEEKKKSPKESGSKKASNKTDEDDDGDGNTKKKAGGAGNKAKKPGSQFYAAYMRREGPKNPGSKPIPIGKQGCFAGLKFLITGVLDSMERDYCKTIIEKYGGSLMSTVSKKLDYMIIGDEAGKSKLDKAEEFGIKQINEDEFLKLICTKSNITNPKYEGDVEMMEHNDEEEKEEKPVTKQSSQSPKKEKKIEKEKVKEGKSSKLKRIQIESDSEEETKPARAATAQVQPVHSKKSPAKPAAVIKQEKIEVKSTELSKSASLPASSTSKSAAEAVTALSSITSTKPAASSQPTSSSSAASYIKKENSNSSAVALGSKSTDESIENRLWVDKYKPTSINKIIGQNTEKSNANKLMYWLKNWHKWHGSTAQGDSKAKKPWNDQETGSSFKAALLSGPPGIGKTTTAQLACKELGFTFVELNASDSRSKKLLDNLLGESVENCSIESYFSKKPTTAASHQKSEIIKDDHCIIMDEVDGMAGNEDRGGVQELINTIKHSKIPIICICNDRQHVKIRSLANYCFDLRFYKPRLEQIRGSLMSVCFKEGVKITPDLLDQIIAGSNYDIRQCLYNLSMWSSNNKNLSSTKTSQKDIETAIKDVRMNPFEACKLTFQHEQPGANRPKLSIVDRLDLFFTDYSLMPLLIQENYLSVKVTNLKETSVKVKREAEQFRNLSDAIESLCNSDRVGRILRTNNNWSLLPTQAIFTTLLPGERMSGNIGLPAFPSWFGKNSKQGRVDRILQELQKHMRLHISANKIGVGLDYLPILKNLLSKPLIKKGSDGVDQVIHLMNEYFLTREDFDTIMELSTWPGQKDPLSLIDSKVKASFTRTYNKESHMNPFCAVSVKKLKGGSGSAGVGGEEGGEDGGENNYGEEEEEENDKEEDDITSDAMIKVKKKTAAVKRPAASKDGSEDVKPTANKRKKV